MTIEPIKQTSGRSFTGEYGAKFWRESQKRPTDWLIVPGDRGQFFVQYIGVLK